MTRAYELMVIIDGDVVAHPRVQVHAGTVTV